MFELKVKKKTLESAYYTRFSRILWMELMMGLEPMTSALPTYPAQKLDFALPSKSL